MTDKPEWREPLEEEACSTAEVSDLSGECIGCYTRQALNAYDERGAEIERWKIQAETATSMMDIAAERVKQAEAERDATRDEVTRVVVQRELLIERVEKAEADGP